MTTYSFPSQRAALPTKWLVVTAAALAVVAIAGLVLIVSQVATGDSSATTDATRAGDTSTSPGNSGHAVTVGQVDAAPAYSATYRAEWLDEAGEHFNVIQIDYNSPTDWKQTTIDSDWKEQIGTYDSMTAEGLTSFNAVNGSTEFRAVSGELRHPGAIMFSPVIEMSLMDGSNLSMEEAATALGWQTVESDGSAVTLTSVEPAPQRMDWNPSGGGQMERVAKFDAQTGIMLYHAWVVDGDPKSEISVVEYATK